MEAALVSAATGALKPVIGPVHDFLVFRSLGNMCANFVRNKKFGFFGRFGDRTRVFSFRTVGSRYFGYNS